MITDWSDSAVEFARDYLKNDAGACVGIAYEARTLGMTIAILKGSVASAALSVDPVRRELLQWLLAAANEQNLV